MLWIMLSKVHQKYFKGLKYKFLCMEIQFDAEYTKFYNLSIKLCEVLFVCSACSESFSRIFDMQFLGIL